MARRRRGRYNPGLVRVRVTVSARRVRRGRVRSQLARAVVDRGAVGRRVVTRRAVRADVLRSYEKKKRRPDVRPVALASSLSGCRARANRPTGRPRFSAGIGPRQWAISRKVREARCNGGK